MATDATTGASNINGTPLSPNGSTGAPMTAVTRDDNPVGVHMNGTPMTTDAARRVEEDFIVDDVDRLVVKQMQSGFPIDQICRYIPSVKKSSMRYEFYSIDERPIKTTVSAAYAPTTAVAGDVTITVANAGMFRPTDTILVKSVAAVAAPASGTDSRTAQEKAPLRLFVTEKVSNTQIKVIALNGKVSNNQTIVPAIAADTEIYRMGNAAYEGDVQTNIFSSMPTKRERYMQIFKTQISESTIMSMSRKEADFTFSDQAELALRDLRKRIEISYIFGTQSYTYDPNADKWVYTCGGIIEQMLEGSHMISYDAKQANANGTKGIADESTLIKNFVQPIFLGNSGSPKRYMFAGSNFVSQIACLPGIQKQMDARQVERKYGVDWKSIQFMTWQLNMYQHPLLDEFGMSNCAIVLDLAYVQKAVFRSLSEDVLELVKSGTFDGKSTVWTEISSICLKYPETHALIYDTNEFSPSI